MSPPGLMAETRAPDAVLDLLSAKRLDKRIRRQVTTITDGLVELKALVEEAKTGEIHRALGYKSWPAYVADAVMFKDVRLPRPLRRELVCWLRAEGLSQRGIGDTLGIPRNTVKSDLRTQVDQIDPPGTGAIADTRRDAITPVNARRDPFTTVTGADGKQYSVLESGTSLGARGAQHLSELDKLAGQAATWFGNTIKLTEAWNAWATHSAPSVRIPIPCELNRVPSASSAGLSRYDLDQIESIREYFTQAQNLLAEMKQPDRG